MMRKILLSATMLAALAVPTLAGAQQTCEQHRNTRTGATVAGGVAGALLGAVIAGKGSNTEGALIGGAGGALIGNQIAKAGKDDCINAYGYYDRAGTWHANNGRASVQTGYYDRDGNWVDGVPRGYYDNGRWVPSNVDTARAGYRDQDGRWIPVTSNGYYDADNRYQQGVVSGYYDNGRWVEGRTSGRYDASGRWIRGAPAGRQDANGNWIYDPQPGYWNNGRWIAGTTRGYYDTRGTWISVVGYAGNEVRPGNTADSSQPRDVQSRIARIDQRITRGESDRSLSRSEVYRARTELKSVRRYANSLTNRRGRLNTRNEALVQARIDRLSDMIRDARQEARAY